MKKVDRLFNLTILISMPKKAISSTSSLDEGIGELVNMIFISMFYIELYFIIQEKRSQ